MNDDSPNDPADSQEPAYRVPSAAKPRPPGWQIALACTMVILISLHAYVLYNGVAGCGYDKEGICKGYNGIVNLAITVISLVTGPIAYFNSAHLAPTVRKITLWLTAQTIISWIGLISLN
jgi:hypothetical protein